MITKDNDKTPSIAADSAVAAPERKEFLTARHWLTIFVSAGFVLVLTLSGVIDAKLSRAAAARLLVEQTAELQESYDEADMELAIQSQNESKTRTVLLMTAYAEETTAKEEELAEAAKKADAAAKAQQTAQSVYTPTQLVASNNFADIAAASASNYSGAGARYKKAWLYIPNTGINHVVVQYSNNDYFLRRTAYEVPNEYGCFFFDYNGTVGSRGNLSRNLVIYGHSFKDKYWNLSPANQKFAVLNMFRDSVQFCRNNPYIYLTNSSETLVYQIFAVSVTNEALNYRSANVAQSAVETIRDLSYYDYDVAVSGSDNLLTLSACLYNHAGVYLGYPNNYRMVVMAKLLPAGAQLYSNVNVSVNSNRKNAFSANYY